MSLGSRGAGPDRDGEEGFTLIELTVAMSLLAVVLVGFAAAMYGGMSAWAASRQRSAFVEIANAEMETMRALPYDIVGVNKTIDVVPTTPGWTAAYPSEKRQSRDLVDVTSVDTAGRAPLSVTTVTTSPVRGVPLPYTVRRWVSWTDVTGGTGHVFKRLEVQIDWTENNERARSLTLTSVLYPGGQGSGGANTLPVASFTVAPGTAVTALQSVSFDGTASSDGDGDALTYSWSFGDGTTISGTATTVHSYAAAGTYTVVLTVIDSKGGSASSSQTMTVAASSNQTPTASFSLTPSSGIAPMSVNVDATASSDPDGNALTYTWSWGDGTANGSGVNATHSYASAGTFTITLTVADTSNATAAATSTVTVTPLNCDVTSGSFRNPSSNGTGNDIVVGSNAKPTNGSFTFTATSNTACTTVTARLPYDGNTWAVPLTATGTTNGVVTWQATASFPSSGKFNTGSAQTGEFWSPGSTGTADKLSFTFGVHT